jgi:hypothetical protein
MFLFGGIAVFLVTQLHGLGLTVRGKLAIALPLLAIMTAFYATFPETLGGLPRMAMILYTGSFLLAAVVWVLWAVSRPLQRARTPA